MCLVRMTPGPHTCSSELDQNTLPSISFPDVIYKHVIESRYKNSSSSLMSLNFSPLSHTIDGGILDLNASKLNIVSRMRVVGGVWQKLDLYKRKINK